MTFFSLPVRRALLLFIGGVVGVFAVLPHPGRHVPEFLAYALVIGAAAAVGTYVAPRAGLISPLIDAALTRRPFLRRSLEPAAWGLGAGLATALVVVVLDLTLFSSQRGGAVPFWTGALYALAGGISEEVVFHFGLLAVLAWAARRWMPDAAAYWAAIGFAALALALSQVHGAPLDVTRTLLLTAIAGVVTGWLYWRRGLEAAMLAHGIAGFALHVATPGVFQVSG